MPAMPCMAEGTFARFRGVLDCPTSYQHWQLRDLVHCDPQGSDNDVYCVNHTLLIRYNVDAHQAECLHDLTFEPTSMAVGQGFVAAGGDRSQLYVARVADGRAVYDHSVGGSVNNSLHIASNANGFPTLFVCNNDQSIKVYDLQPRALRQYTQIRCNTAINAVACTGSDVQHLVAVGDSKDVVTYRQRAGGYERVSVYRELEGPCMSCAWNSTGSCFAVASQERKVAVWDPRVAKAIVQFQTEEACRNVKFSTAPVDLLAFSENRERVHIVDARCWGSAAVRQTSLVAPLGTAGDMNISGVAWSATSHMLYVGVEEGLSVFDIKVQSRRAFLHAGPI